MNRRKLVSTSVVGLFSSIFGFLGIISCCGFPLIAAFLAWFGIGASQLSFFSEYQHLFTWVAIIALLYGFYTIYIKQAKVNTASSCCDTDNNSTSNQFCCTSSKKTSWLTKIMLWIGVIAVSATFFVDADNSNASNSEQSCCSVSSEEPILNLHQEKSRCSKSKSSNAATKENNTTEKFESCCSR